MIEQNAKELKEASYERDIFNQLVDAGLIEGAPLTMDEEDAGWQVVHWFLNMSHDCKTVVEYAQSQQRVVKVSRGDSTGPVEMIGDADTALEISASVASTFVQEILDTVHDEPDDPPVSFKVAHMRPIDLAKAPEFDGW